jgi:hypothetical protein
MRKGNKLHLETLKLLVIHPIFQQRVKKIRGIFGITTDGLLGENKRITAKIRNDWRIELRHRDVEYESSPETQEDEQNAKFGLDKGELSEDDYEDAMLRISRSLPSARWHDEIGAVLGIFKLGENYRDAISAYVRWGSFSGSRLLPQSFKIERIPPTSRPAIRIDVYNPLKKSEWQELTKRVNEELNGAPWHREKKYRPHPQLERDVEIWKAYLDLKDKNTGDRLYMAIVAKCFAEDEGFGSSDIKRDKAYANQAKLAVHRTKRALKERFGFIKWPA